MKTPTKLLRKYLNLRDEASCLLKEGDITNYINVLLDLQKVKNQLLYLTISN